MTINTIHHHNHHRSNSIIARTLPATKKIYHQYIDPQSAPQTCTLDTHFVGLQTTTHSGTQSLGAKMYESLALIRIHCKTIGDSCLKCDSTVNSPNHLLYTNESMELVSRNLPIYDFVFKKIFSSPIEKRPVIDSR